MDGLISGGGGGFKVGFYGMIKTSPEVAALLQRLEIQNFFFLILAVEKVLLPGYYCVT